MREPSARTSRLAIAAGLAAFIAVGAGGFLLGRGTAPKAPPPAPAPVTVIPPPIPVQPQLPRLWGRAEIADLARRAADALSSGKPLPDDIAGAVGQRFDLSLPFGCSGAAEKDSTAPMRWRYDEAAGVLRVHVRPISWKAADLGLPAQGDGHDAEGFWMLRPWSTNDECPAPAKATAPEPDGTAPTPDQSLALAQFGQNDGNDLWRHGRPFEKVLRLAPEDFTPTRGLRLRLIGRIERVPGNGPVHCAQPLGIEQRPVCVLAVTLREVRMEMPGADAPIAIWENRSTGG